MKLSPVTASLVALALFAAAGAAEAGKQAESLMPTAQVEDSPQELVTIRQFLANGKDIAKMKLPRLQQRLHRAESFRDVQGLPPDIDQALAQEIARITQEIARREQGAAAPEAPAAEAQQQPEPKLEDPPLPPFDPQQADQQQGQSEQPVVKRQKRQQQAQDQVQQAAPPAQPEPQQAQPSPGQPAPEAATGSPAAATFLQSVRPAAGLGEADLRQQMGRAVELSQASGLSPDQRRALREVIRDARAELRKAPGEAQQQPPAEQPAPPPVSEQQQPPPPAAQPPATGQTAPAAPAASQAQQPPAAPTDTQLANPAVNPALERKAQAYLSDGVDVREMKRKQLRKRLADIRDLLATNQLSPGTREALRQKLAEERAVLRREVAVDEGLPPPAVQPPQQQGQQPGNQPPAPQPPQQGGSTTSSSNVIVNNNTTVNNTTTNTDLRVVLQDRRPPGELDDRELVRRIDVYRNVVQDDRYDAEQRMLWQQQMEADRRYLRRQMMAERRQREARLREGDYQFNLDVQDRYEPGYDVPDDVFAAEADDSEIADVLAAPPRRQVQPRYTVQDIEQQPQLREAVARIEIDTVHFGFGEGFLREEEIDKLDRIASVLEKILAKHPDEVFLIEGHTDAVGSDASNLVLSRQRAAAVKEALTTYYVIPPENLKTVGLGERYLKIPTNQPEAENRRVSLARITALVGQASD